MRYLLLVLFGVSGMLLSIPPASQAQVADTLRIEVPAPSRPARGIDRVRNRLHGQRAQQPSVIVIMPPAQVQEVVRETPPVGLEPRSAVVAEPATATSLIPPLPPLQTLTPAERAQLEAISPGLASQLQQQVHYLSSPTSGQDRIIVVNVPYVPPAVVPETLFVERVVEVFPEPSPSGVMPEVRPLVPPFEAQRSPAIIERDVERSVIVPSLLQTSHVYFEFNTHTPVAGTEQMLRPLGEVLARNPELRLEVVGHTDSVGSDEVNLRISLERAEAVRAYMITHFNVRPEQLTARGVGAAEPLVSNQTANGRALNRRVEFRVLSL